MSTTGELPPLPIHPQLGPDFHVEKLLSIPEGAVVLDLSGYVDAFYVQTTNSRKQEAIVSRVRHGDLIPVGADALGDLTSNHALLHVYLHNETRIPIIPTTVNLVGVIPGITGNTEFANYPAAVIPGIFVHKTGGHRGEGVTMVNRDEAAELLGNLKPISEFMQPFILPPVDPDGKRRVRDIRIISVDGKPVAGIVKTARNPLTYDMIIGRSKPRESYYPAHNHPRELGPISQELWDQVVPFAEAINRFLAHKIDVYRHRLYSPQSKLGMISTDFLLSERGVPLLTDCDVSPHVSGDTIPPVAAALSRHAVDLAQRDKRQRLVVVIGNRERELVTQTVQQLLQSGYPQEKLVLQDIWD